MDDEMEDPPETEDETSDEVEDLANMLTEVRARTAQELLTRMDELQKSVTKLGTQLQSRTFKSPSMEEVRSKPVRDPIEKARDNKSDKTVDKAEKKVQKVLAKNDGKKATTEPEPDEKRPADAKEWAGSKIMLFITGATFFGPTLLRVFEGLVKAMSGDKSGLDALGLPDEISVKLMAFATDKKAETNDAFWKDVGDFVAKQPDASGADLIMMLQYIAKISPLSTGFLWPSMADAGSMAETLAPQFTTDRGKFFTGLGTLKTAGGQLLPRATAAGVAQNAIALSLGS